MKRTVTITSGIRMYTAYEGRSEKQAIAHMDTARNVLVMVSGTAMINYRENGKLTLAVTVTDGTFTQENF